MNHEDTDQRRGGRTSGDEPPIRVKGGSLDIQLLTKQLKWHKDGDDSHWSISGGTRSKDDLDIVVALCGGPPIARTGKVLEILHEGGVHLRIESKSLHTKLTRVDDDSKKEHLKQDLLHQHWLRYEPKGEITQVLVDTKPFWNSGGGTSLCEMLVLDCG